MSVSLKVMGLIPVFLALFIFPSSCGNVASAPHNSDMSGPKAVAEHPVGSKIDGVALVAPPNPLSESDLTHMVNANVGWVQVIPYAFSRAGKPGVNFNYPFQWWGEKEEGATKTIEYAKNLGLKVLIKPHIWVREQGWAGEFTLDNEADWVEWEKNYTKYIMTYARIAEEKDADMLCLGTEFRMVVRNRPDFFGRLADEVRTVYKGPITYASNWDNYQYVQFWDKVDYMGVDAYFPLVDAKTPSVNAIEDAWSPLKKDLKNLSEKHGKQVLFTEYGYLCVDKGGWRTWELEGNLSSHPLNPQAQANCYQGLYNAVWEEDWFAGGFAWHWYANHNSVGGKGDRDWTPQNKPAFEVMKKRYK